MTARPAILALTLSACAPATATLQAKCAGFGFTTPSDIAGCTERRHDKALDRQFAVLRIAAGAVSAGMFADALAGLGRSVASIELPDITPVIDVTLPPIGVGP